MQLRFAVMSDAEVHRISFGAVDNPVFPEPLGWEAAKGSVYDPRTFGAKHDWQCACREYRGEQHEGTICDRCGVKVGVARALRRKRFGHIDLLAPVAHPLNEQTDIVAIPVLPIAYRETRAHGDDLSFLYTQIIHANGGGPVPGDEPTAGGTGRVATRIRELFCNEWLDEPRCVDGRPLRSLLHYLLEDPARSLATMGVYLTALGLKPSM